MTTFLFQIANGDDLAVALLIKLDVSTGSMMGGGIVPDLITQAKSLGYAKIAHRLEKVYTVQSVDSQESELSPAGQANAINEKIEVFNDYPPAHWTASRQDIIKILAEVRSGYEDNGLLAVSSSSINKEGEVAHRPRECFVDRMALKDLSVERFQRVYVSLNKPLVILTDEIEDSQSGVLITVCGVK